MFLSATKNGITTTVAFVCLALLFLTVSYSLVPTHVLTAPFASEPAAPAESRDIPNIIHYTQLKRDSHSILQFDFESFLSLYSAVLFLAPTTVYIHTDHNATAIEAAKTSGSKWTKKVLNTFPDIVKINEVTGPTELNGHYVHVEARSDFVRWEILHKFGGLYIDWDVLPLRDISSLRTAGFNSVVGRQPGGNINPGCLMTKAGSALAQLMRQYGPVVFDGAWETHSVTLVTRISERIAGTPGEMLILDHNAMAPTSWYTDSVDWLFMPHNETGSSEVQLHDQVKDPLERWDNRIDDRGWKMDLGQTYLLHAFKARGHDVPNFKHVTVPYVVAQNSNFGLAAWPAVEHMLKNDVVTEDDI